MSENSYLSSIENEFSRGRGKASRLNPIDWDLAASWETDGVPLHIALGAMTDGFKKFAGQNPKGEISSLRYFIPMVNKRFEEWKTSQVGKSPEPILRQVPFMKEDNMQGSAIKQFPSLTDENVAILDALAEALMPDSYARCNFTLPEPLASAVVQLRGEILSLLDEVTQKQISSGAIEARLTELRTEFELSLIVSVSDEERTRIIKDVKEEYGKFALMPDVENKILIRKLHQKFSLPELTLFKF